MPWKPFLWNDLHGRDFAERTVAIGRRIGPACDDAWTWAPAMRREERQERLRAVERGRTASNQLDQGRGLDPVP